MHKSKRSEGGKRKVEEERREQRGKHTRERREEKSVEGKEGKTAWRKVAEGRTPAGARETKAKYSVGG